MTNELPVLRSGDLTFHLQLAQNLQLHITHEPATGGRLLIEGHDISALLDFLYDNREFIYEATHDRELRCLEALNAPLAVGVEERRIERFFYLDDGRERVSFDG
jgi:hypothetical protein